MKKRIYAQPSLEITAVDPKEDIFVLSTEGIGALLQVDLGDDAEWQ